jgi:hypothetical protein
MHVGCFVRKGIVYRPIWGQVEGGGPYRAIEPVAVVPVSDADGLRRALRDGMAIGNPIIPEVPWDQVEPVVFKRAGVKNQSEFQRGGTFPVDIEERDGRYRVIVQRRRRPYQGWENDPDHTYDLPPGSTLEDAIERAIQLIQENARQQSARA